MSKDLERKRARLDVQWKAARARVQHLEERLWNISLDNEADRINAVAHYWRTKRDQAAKEYAQFEQAINKIQAQCPHSNRKFLGGLEWCTDCGFQTTDGEPSVTLRIDRVEENSPDAGITRGVQEWRGRYKRC